MMEAGKKAVVECYNCNQRIRIPTISKLIMFYCPKCEDSNYSENGKIISVRDIYKTHKVNPKKSKKIITFWRVSSIVLMSILISLVARLYYQDLKSPKHFLEEQIEISQNAKKEIELVKLKSVLTNDSQLIFEALIENEFAKKNSTTYSDIFYFFNSLEIVDSVSTFTLKYKDSIGLNKEFFVKVNKNNKVEIDDSFLFD